MKTKLLQVIGTATLATTALFTVMAGPASAATRTPATKARPMSTISIAPLPSPFPNPDVKPVGFDVGPVGRVSIAPLPSPFPNPDVTPVGRVGIAPLPSP